MFQKMSIKVMLKNLSLVGIGMILALVLSSWLPRASQAMQAEARPSMFMAVPNAPDGSEWASCVPTEVMTYYNRVHVRCAAAVGGNISYFATPISNPANAARILSTLSTAQVAGRTLTILYDPDDLSGVDFGCLEADCRTIRAVGFGQ